MDPSALSTAARSLESSSDSLSGWLFFFTLLVVIGLIVEYWHVFRNLLTKRNREAKHLQEVIGGILITVGVAGELAVQPFENRVEHKLRSANHLIEASLIKSSEVAKAKAREFELGIAISKGAAANANERAGKANERAAIATRQAVGAEEEAAKANERAAALEKDAAVQRARAATSELELFKLRQRLEPRRLDAEHLGLLTDALKRSPAKGLVNIRIALGDNEAISFAAQLERALKNAGWQTSSEQAAFRENPIGLFLVIHSAVAAPPHAVFLQRSFDAAGLSLPAEEHTTNPNNDVTLIVGVKPPPQ
jgi:hypothetical protein